MDKKLYGILGKNIGYSLSPRMHNAAFRHFGIDAEYVLFDVEEKGLDVFVSDNILSGRLEGFNITVPYKMKIKEKLQKSSLKLEINDWVRIVNAANTVKMNGNVAELWNTDILGFFDSLNMDLGYRTQGAGDRKACFIVGAGGAGRAIALFLKGMVAPLEIYVYDIDAAKLKVLEKDFMENFRHLTRSGINILSSQEEIRAAIEKCDLLVNASPLGTRETDPMPVPEDCLRQDLSVYDLVYARRTELVEKAGNKGARAVNGQGMLIRQGAIAFNKWTGMDVEETARVMKEALTKK
jgi:shikimate dehydrogenase